MAREATNGGDSFAAVRAVPDAAAMASDGPHDERDGLAAATVASAAPATATSFFRRHAAKLLISLGLGAGIAWLMGQGGLPLLPPSWAGVRWWTVGLYVLSLVGVHWFRAVRWRFLLRPLGDVPTRSVVAVSWIAFAAILLSPLRSGEVVRPYLITRRGSVRLWEASATIGAERVIDGLILSVVLFAALQLTTPLSPLPDHVGDLPVPVAMVPGAAYLVLAVFFSAFALMALFFWRRDFARRLTAAVVGLVSRRLAEIAARIVERVADGLRFLPSGRLFAPFLLETVLYWVLNAFGLWLLGWGVGLEEMTLGHAAVTMGCIGIGILVPAGPGYFGAFQLATYMALAMFFPEEVVTGAGARFVFLVYACQVGWHILAALLALIVDPDTKPAIAVASGGA